MVAGQHAQAAGVDAQRLVEAVLGAEVGDRPVAARRRGGAGTSVRRRWPCRRRIARMSSYSAMKVGLSRSCDQSRCPGDGDRVAVARPAAGVDPGEETVTWGCQVQYRL